MITSDSIEVRLCCFFFELIVSIQVKRACCIVPPPYFVENIGSPGTYGEVDISPAATENNVT